MMGRPGWLRAVALLVAVLLAGAAIALVLGPLVSGAISAFGLGPAPYAEVVLRSLQVACLAAIALAIRPLAPAASGWGVAWRPAAARRFLTGLAAGVLSMGLVAIVLFSTEVREVRHDLIADAAQWVLIALKALLAALVIACLEELMFRGGLYSLLAHAGGVASAVVLTGVVYAATHFLARGDDAGAGPVGFGDTLDVFSDSVASILRTQNLDSMLALAVAGLWLAVLRRRDGDIAACIGTHAGWVLVIKVFKKLTYIDPDAELAWMAGSYDGMIGWMAAAVLGVFAVQAAWSSRLHLRGARS